MRKQLNSLQARLTILIFIVALPGIMLLFYQANEQRTLALEHARQRAIETLELLASDQSRLIEDTRTYLQRLALFPEAQAPEAAACSRFLARIIKLNSNYVNLGVPRADGELLCNAFPLKKSINVADRPYIRHTLGKREFAIGEFQMDRAAGVTSVNFSYPLINPSNDQLIGAVVAVVSLDWWSKRLEESLLPEDSMAYIADSQNTISAYYPPDPTRLGMASDELDLDVIETVWLADRQFTIGRINGGSRRIFVSKQLLTTSADNTLTAVLGIPFEQEWSNIDADFFNRLALLAVFTLLMLAIAIYGVRLSLLNPIRSLSKYIGDHEKGMGIDDLRQTGASELVALGKQFFLVAETRVAAEEKLKKSEEKLLYAQRLAHMGHWDLDPVSGKLNWSDEVFRIFEVDKEKFAASNEIFFEVVHPDDREFVGKAYSDSLNHRKPYNIEHRLLMKDGRIKYVHERAEILYDTEGKPCGSLGTVADITERKLAEQALKQSEERFRTVFNQQFQFMAILSKDGATQEVNELTLRMQGGREQDYVGKLFWDSPAWRDLPEWRETWPRRLEQARHMQEPLLTKDVYRAADGSIRYADASTLALRARDGQVTGFLIQASDTTDRHLAFEEARDTNRVLSSIFGLLDDLFFLLDRNGVIIDYRARETSDLYVSPEVFIGKTMQDVLPPEVGVLFTERLKLTATERSSAFEYALPMEGVEHFFEARLAKLPESDRCIAVVRDISSRKQDELQKSEQLDELRRWYDATLGREGRVLELKREINALAVEFGREPPYSSAAQGRT